MFPLLFEGPGGVLEILEGSWCAWEACTGMSWRLSGASLERLGRVSEASWGVLPTSWGRSWEASGGRPRRPGAPGRAWAGGVATDQTLQRRGFEVSGRCRHCGRIDDVYHRVWCAACPETRRIKEEQGVRVSKAPSRCIPSEPWLVVRARLTQGTAPTLTRLRLPTVKSEDPWEKP